MFFLIAIRLRMKGGKYTISNNLIIVEIKSLFRDKDRFPIRNN
jgi:hypothetical protein